MARTYDEIMQSLDAEDAATVAAAITAQVTEAQKNLDTVTAERDSLAVELASEKSAHELARAELKSTKEANFTLIRRLDAGPPAESAEDILNKMF